MSGALSDKRTGLSFRITAHPRQRSHSRVRVPWHLQPYFIPSHSRHSFSSPSTTLRDTLEVSLRVRVRDALRLAVYSQSFCIGVKPLETHGQNSFLLNTCHRPYVTSSLTKEWVCRLQLLLALVSAFILRSVSRWTHDHILLSQIQDSPNLEGRVPVLISPRNRVAQ
jgi:hypothetical protein